LTMINSFIVWNGMAAFWTTLEASVGDSIRVGTLIS
jgi:hypothetical protein